MPDYWRDYLWYQANNLLEQKVSNERRAEVRNSNNYMTNIEVS
ncbi:MULTISPECIES: hypothetical protein [Klebsiella]|nr:hypothetical protein [Klebsiella quasivariicola]